MNSVQQLKDKIIEICRTEEDPDEIIEENVITDENWDDVQQACFEILLDQKVEESLCENIADLFWIAVLHGRKIQKKTAIALLYYRLGRIDDPYENNTIWGITTKLYHLDYCDSEYNPLTDPKILQELTSHGIDISKLQK